MEKEEKKEPEFNFKLKKEVKKTQNIKLAKICPKCRSEKTYTVFENKLYRCFNCNNTF